MLRLEWVNFMTFQQIPRLVMVGPQHKYMVHATLISDLVGLSWKCAYLTSRLTANYMANPLGPS